MPFMSVNFTGQIGPTFFLLLILAGVGLYVAVKYRTNEALKDAVDAWRENAEAHEEKADRLGAEVRDLRAELAAVRVELDELKKRAPELQQITTQMERMASGIDLIFEHVSAKTP